MGWIRFFRRIGFGSNFDLRLGYGSKNVKKKQMPLTDDMPKFTLYASIYFGITIRYRYNDTYKRYVRYVPKV